MPVSKRTGSNWHDDYTLHLKLGAALSLALLLTAANLTWYKNDVAPPTPPPPEAISAKEITQTEHRKETPPPPPAPPVPVEVPNDQIIESGEDIDWDRLDIRSQNDGPPAPPPEDDEPEEPLNFVPVEDQPQLNGGMQALYDEVRYPRRARQAGIEGRVIVQFVVSADGTVTDAKVARGVHPLLDEEALRAVRQMTFEPGMQRGEPVPVRMSLPVTFRLE